MFKKFIFSHILFYILLLSSSFIFSKSSFLSPLFNDVSLILSLTSSLVVPKFSNFQDSFLSFSKSLFSSVLTTVPGKSFGSFFLIKISFKLVNFTFIKSPILIIFSIKSSNHVILFNSFFAN